MNNNNTNPAVVSLFRDEPPPIPALIPSQGVHSIGSFFIDESIETPSTRIAMARGETNILERPISSRLTPRKAQSSKGNKVNRNNDKNNKNNNLIVEDIEDADEAESEKGKKKSQQISVMDIDDDNGTSSSSADDENSSSSHKKAKSIVKPTVFLILID